MLKPALFLMAATLLGTAACTNSAVEQSGGSGLRSSSVGTLYGGANLENPYGADLHNPSTECRPNDINCWEIYNGPGGG